MAADMYNLHTIHHVALPPVGNLILSDSAPFRLHRPWAIEVM